MSTGKYTPLAVKNHLKLINTLNDINKDNVLKNDLILNKTYQSWVNLQYDLYKCLVYKLLENQFKR